MPQLENQRHEFMAQCLAEGMSAKDAAAKAGYYGTQDPANYARSRGGTISRLPQVKARVAEIQREKYMAVQRGKEDGARASAMGLDFEANRLYERFTQAVPVESKGAWGKSEIICDCGKKHFAHVWKFDGKNALEAINLRAKLAGLYVKNVNVNHRRSMSFEGTRQQIWEKVHSMLEPLGRELKEWLMDKWGYEVIPKNLQLVSDVEVDGRSAPDREPGSGTGAAEQAGEASDSAA